MRKCLENGKGRVNKIIIFKTQKQFTTNQNSNQIGMLKDKKKHLNK